MNSHMRYKIGDVVTFAKLRGYVQGYTTLKRMSHADEYHTYLIVELDSESRGYMRDHEVTISFYLLNPENVESHNGLSIEVKDYLIG